MTLHDAIVQVLALKNGAMTVVEIAYALNKNNLYTKKDTSLIKSNQISARVKNYPHLFIKEGSYISVKSSTGIKKIPAFKSRKVQLEEVNKNTALALKVLMNAKNFKPASKIDGEIPGVPGVYCLRIKDKACLSEPFSKVLEDRKHNIIYIGIASQSLNNRLGQELRAKGHGTFFRSIGAVLGFTPEKGSLIGKKNQNNYKFSKINEQKIIKWINENLLVNWVQISEGLNRIENDLLRANLPLFNIDGNPGSLSELTVSRNNCRRIGKLPNEEK